MRSFFSKDMPFDRKRDEVNRLFATAMDEIDGARETIGTTYFQEDLDSASEATKVCTYFASSPCHLVVSKTKRAQSKNNNFHTTSLSFGRVLYSNFMAVDQVRYHSISLKIVKPTFEPFLPTWSSLDMFLKKNHPSHINRKLSLRMNCSSRMRRRGKP